MNTQHSLNAIKSTIATYENKYARQANSVRLLAASKSQSIEKIKAAFEAGQRCFGENYLQEALKKMQALKNEAIEWHFIGSLQSNKSKKIAEHFDWVQSVHSKHLAKRLSDQRPENLGPLNICIEVNISHEARKSGVMPDMLMPLAEYCLGLPRIRLRGMMVIPEQMDNIEKQADIFHQAYLLFCHMQMLSESIDTLSMGMTHDLEAAIANGSTMVRVGTGIFGKRD